MSEPSYRIEVTYDHLTHTSFKYDWHVWRLSNATLQATGTAETRDTAVLDAQAAITALGKQERSESLYTDEEGKIMDAVPEPQSLRADEWCKRQSEKNREAWAAGREH